MTENIKKDAVSGLESTRRQIKIDERGNAVWKWRTEDAEESQDADLTFNMLKSLDVASLEIEDMKIKKANRLGTDPYNSKPKKGT